MRTQISKLGMIGMSQLVITSTSEQNDPVLMYNKNKWTRIAISENANV